VHAAVIWSVLNVGLVWLAIRRIRSPRYAAERRSSVRFGTDLPGRLDGLDVRVRDLSLTGARIELPRDASLAPHGRLVVDVAGGGAIELDTASRATWTDRGRTYAGIEFTEGQFLPQARLAQALFGSAAGRATGAPVELAAGELPPQDLAGAASAA